MPAGAGRRISLTPGEERGTYLDGTSGGGLFLAIRVEYPVG